MIDKQCGMQSIFSFGKLIDFWRGAAQSSTDSLNRDFARKLISDIEAVPELMQPITDFSVIDKNRKLVDAMLTAIFPPSYMDTNLQAISTPLGFKAVCYTQRFKDLFMDEEGNFDTRMNVAPGLFNNGKVVAVYSGILRQFYGIDMTVVFPLVRTIIDEQTGLERHFKLNMDNRFIDVKVLGELPEITNEHITLLSENLLNVDLWYEIIPPDLFAFEGIMTINMFEVTDQEALSMLKYDLLDKNILLTQSGFDMIEKRIRTMFRNPKLKLGLASISDDKSHLLNSGNKIGNSFLLSDSCVSKCAGYSNSIYQKAIDTQKPQIIHDLNIFPECTPIEKEIVRMGVNNILVAPLVYEGKTIGILEVGSPKAGDVNSINGLKLIQMLPLFSVAMKRSLEDLENKVQAIIKEKCTAIHPSVEWRFRQAAINLLTKEATDEYAQMEEIKFKEVYPLYALSDIRNSSVIRNRSIQEDLKKNLNLAKDIITAAGVYKKMQVLDHLKFRIDKRIMALEGGLSSGDEAGIIAFLKSEIEPLFEKLGTYGEKVNESIAEYRSAQDSNLGIVYDKRKDYEESVSQLNEHIASYVEDEEQKAQLIYPHYFEKYKTDGVEFTMYIGDSISEKESFSPLYLRNIRLWQFMLMCGIAARAESIKPNLKVPLDLAHLILVQNAPLSIRFHFDQKKFDVDGTYNVHYEIMKKRIDKAEIRGREERLTQPGKVAIVYNQPAEAYEYRQYIEYLQSTGCLEKEIEDLELEDLQGVYGLKALRVAINTKSQFFNNDLSIDKINNAVKELEVAN